MSDDRVPGVCGIIVTVERLRELKDECGRATPMTKLLVPALEVYGLCCAAEDLMATARAPAPPVAAEVAT